MTTFAVKIYAPPSECTDLVNNMRFIRPVLVRTLGDSMDIHFISWTPDYESSDIRVEIEYQSTHQLNDRLYGQETAIIKALQGITWPSSSKATMKDIFKNLQNVALKPYGIQYEE